MRLDERGEQAIALAMLHNSSRTDEYPGFHDPLYRGRFSWWVVVDFWCQYEFKDRNAAAELYCWVYDLLPVEGD